LHIITDLRSGGAEYVLFRLLANDNINTHSVVILGQIKGTIGNELLKRGIEVFSLNISWRKLDITSFYELYKTIKRVNPNIVQTWMYHANLVGSLIAKIAGEYSTIWCLHAASIDTLSFKTKVISVFNSLISYWLPTKIICVSSKTLQVHKQWGYCANKLELIYNGVDTNEFIPKIDSRAKIRKEWKVDNDTILIGCIARWDHHKDHKTLLSCTKILEEKKIYNFKIVLVGDGMSWDNRRLSEMIINLKLNKCIILGGFRSDVSCLFPALDLNVLSSISEAFPNVLIEAMSCGVPCVATDVGDAKVIVGDTGWIVPPSDPISLARAFEVSFAKIVINDNWKIRKNSCRTRVEKKFTLNHMLESYNKLWEKATSE
jgi:glycosyltransferase involved in cell wall biosynthesis